MAWIQFGKFNKSFTRYLVEMLLVAGIPLIVLELIFIPHRYWGFALLFVVPGTVAGLCVAAVIEYTLICFIQRRKDERDRQP